MAEYVQLHLEETINELEQLQRVGLFTKEEIRKIVKKRNALEYKLQRRIRKQEDFLQYINNEVNLLDLIAKRRRRDGYNFKKDEIENSIIHRINKVFRIAVSRFRSDISLWKCHINFCKKVNYKTHISKLYTKMLQVHSSKPEVWVEASAWEINEQKAFGTARNIMLQALRFHPDSEKIYEAYFDLELKYVERLHKRRKVLKLNDMENEKETSDALLKGGLVRLVYKTAIDKIPAVGFHLALIDICDKHGKYAAEVRNDLVQDLKVLHPEDELVWDFFARRHLKKRAHKEDAIRKCFRTYEEAVEKIPSEKMWTYYIMTCMNVYWSSQFNHTALERLMEVFERCSKLDLLAPEMYLQWIEVLRALDRVHEARAIAIESTTKNPTSLMLWEARIRLLIRSDSATTKKVQKLFDAALTAVEYEKSLPLWTAVIQWSLLSSPKMVEKFYEAGISKGPGNVSGSLKHSYLRHVSFLSGMKNTRALYERMKNLPPITEEFFALMYNIEKSQLQPSIERMRGVLKGSLFHFGTTSMDTWLKWMDLEEKEPGGDPAEASKIYWQALKTIKPELENKFLVATTIRTTGVTLQTPN